MNRNIGHVRFALSIVSLIAIFSTLTPCLAQENPRSQEGSSDIESQRMDVMRARATAFLFRSGNQAPDNQTLPQHVQPEPLFRYDDIPRGYVDGAVWRWGNQGRPLAIVTTELHPNYLGGGNRIVYDFLSFSDFAFTAVADDASWSPSSSALKMKPLPETSKPVPKPAASSAQRRFQMKRIMQRFSAAQVVSAETPKVRTLALRQLARPIDSYQPSGEGTDGAIFLFVAGRMPGVIVVLETDGEGWKFGAGRLSAPSTLTLNVDQQEVWRVSPSTGSFSQPYVATNRPVSIPAD